MQPRDHLGKYELRGTLGRGAMGTVFDGWDPAIGRRVAIKTGRLSGEQDEEEAQALERFKREAQAAGRLSHPNIVGVYDYGETEELAYIVMEFIDGHSLKSMLDQRRRLPPAEAVDVMLQVLAGLEYSHARGVIHRDIKPGNIMRSADGHVKIADFGIARIETSSMTSVGTVMGTPAYMPPEQFRGEAVDARSDIYAAGVMLYQLLAGERPYEGAMTVIMHKVLSAEPPPSASARAETPAVFDGVIARAIAKAPADRYPSAVAFAQALRVALLAAEQEGDGDATMIMPATRVRPAGTAPASTPGSSPTALPVRTGRRSAAVAGGAGLGALALLGAGAWMVSRPAAVVPIPPARLHTEQPAGSHAVRPIAMGMADANAVASALRAAECSALRARPLDNGSIGVSGIVGSGQPEADARRMATRAAPDGMLAWSPGSVPMLYCGVLDAMRLATGIEDDKSVLPMTVGGQRVRVRLTDGSPIVPHVASPVFPAWLIVDYLSNDGSFVHFFPNRNNPARLLAAGSPLSLSAAETGLVGSPYGTDMVLAVASSRPLFTAPRPAGESLQQYLTALNKAIAVAQARGDRTAASIVLVDTAAR